MRFPGPAVDDAREGQGQARARVHLIVDLARGDAPALAVVHGAPDHVVRTVTENSRTLKFTNQGFEKE